MSELTDYHHCKLVCFTVAIVGTSASSSYCVEADAKGASIPDAEMAETLLSRHHQDRNLEQTSPNKGRMTGHPPGRPAHEGKQKQHKQKRCKQDVGQAKTGLKRKRKHRPK